MKFDVLINVQFQNDCDYSNDNLVFYYIVKRLAVFILLNLSYLICNRMPPTWNQISGEENYDLITKGMHNRNPLFALILVTLNTI